MDDNTPTSRPHLPTRTRCMTIKHRARSVDPLMRRDTTIARRIVDVVFFLFSFFSSPPTPFVRVCRAFRNTGRCRYGEDCNYEHSEGDPIEPPPRGQCFNWGETGQCAYGDRCRFLHGEDDDGSRFEKKPVRKS